MNGILVFAYNENSNQSPAVSIRGHFDGEKFIPKLGYCSSYEDLYNFDYVQIFDSGGCARHAPKKYHGDLLEEMKLVYVAEFGASEQIDLFG